MIRLLKSFLFYPAHFAGVWLLMIGHVVAWFCFLTMFLFAVLMIAGEFPPRWGVVAAVGAGGVVVRLLMELYIRMLIRLDPRWDEI